MREFWVVYPKDWSGQDCRIAVKEFPTYGEAFDCARDMVKRGTGDIYILQPHARVHLPVDLEMVSEEMDDEKLAKVAKP